MLGTGTDTDNNDNNDGKLYNKKIKGSSSLSSLHVKEKPDVRTLTAYMSVYTESLDATKALEVFDSFKTYGVSPNARTYRALFRMYVRQKDVRNALYLKEHMQSVTDTDTGTGTVAGNGNGDSNGNGSGVQGVQVSLSLEDLGRESRTEGIYSTTKSIIDRQLCSSSTISYASLLKHLTINIIIHLYFTSASTDTYTYAARRLFLWNADRRPGTPLI